MKVSGEAMTINGTNLLAWMSFALLVISTLAAGVNFIRTSDIQGIRDELAANQKIMAEIRSDVKALQTQLWAFREQQIQTNTRLAILEEQRLGRIR